MNAEDLKAMLERRDKTLKIKSIKVFKNRHFRIVGEDSETKFVRNCMYSIDLVEDRPEWWRNLGV